MENEPHYYNVSPFIAGIRSKCPRCGRGRLFQGFLSTARQCENCKLSFDFADSGDGPAVFIILIVGFIVVACALITEVKFQPPYWVHAALWVPMIVILSLMLLRPFKATLLALQYQNKAKEGELSHD